MQECSDAARRYADRVAEAARGDREAGAAGLIWFDTPVASHDELRAAMAAAFDAGVSHTVQAIVAASAATRRERAAGV